METRWSLTFQMIQKWFLALRVLTVVVKREKVLESYMVGETKRKATKQVRAFLKDATVATKDQFRSLYVTLTITLRIFEKLELNCRIWIEKGVNSWAPLLRKCFKSW